MSKDEYDPISDEAQQAWLDRGSDDLRDAWISICSSGNDHSVQQFRLIDILKEMYAL